MSTDILTILDFIGVISFTISGSLVAARKDMDYLGVCILGIVTAVGGGATRDIIIGRTPPVMFRNPSYVAVAFLVANIVFFFLYFHLSGKAKPKMSHLFGNTLFWFDTIGLASLSPARRLRRKKAPCTSSAGRFSFCAILPGWFCPAYVLRHLPAHAVHLFHQFA